jgi:magnesium transporter
MSAEVLPLIAALNERFLLDFPREAARELETMPPEDVAPVLIAQPPRAVVGAWEILAPDVAAALIQQFPPELARHVLSEAEPVASVAALMQLEPAEREQRLGMLSAAVTQELRELMNYPEDSAGRLMNPRLAPLRAEMLVAEAIKRLRAIRNHGQRALFVIDAEGRLVGRVDTVDLALADRNQPLSSLMRGVSVVVRDLDPREDVVDTMGPADDPAAVRIGAGKPIPPWGEPIWKACAHPPKGGT